MHSCGRKTRYEGGGWGVVVGDGTNQKHPGSASRTGPNHRLTIYGDWRRNSQTLVCTDFSLRHRTRTALPAIYLKVNTPFPFADRQEDLIVYLADQ